jgi:hypothetical protein
MMHPSLGVRFRILGAAGAGALLLALGCGQYGGGEAGSAAATGGPVVSASAPPDPEVALASFQTTVYPLLTTYCASCHAGSGPGSPSFANPDPAAAYSALVNTQKVSFANPSASRLVRRLVADFHNCWSNCMEDAVTMQAAIEAWSAEIASAGGGGTPVEGGLFSNALTLANGIEDRGDERYLQHLVAFWDFKEGTGDIAHDTSGVAPPLDLRLEGSDWEWMTNYGVSFVSGRAIGSAAASRKLWERIAQANSGTQQYSVEAWVVPDNTTQEGPARIVNYSQGTGSRNFGMGQVLYQYDFRNRSVEPEINGNGDPSLRTYDADQDLQATLQHVVLTYDQFRGRRIYVNGRFTDDVDELPPSRLWNWDANHQLVLANETSNNRQWVGRIQLVAIYDHALTEAQIRQNFDAGVGKRLLLVFDVSQWLGPGSGIEFSVREFDQYSYLFCTPTVVTPSASGFRVSNLRILLNGSIPVQGQAFVKLDEVVTSPRQTLSSTCSIIQKDLGAGADVFALAFEVLGGFEDPVAPDPPGGTPPPVFGGAFPNEGIRDFARIRESMAAVTTVPADAASVSATFADLVQQLPNGPDLRAFSSSQQVGIAKLALEYCNELVESPARRAALAPGFDFDATPATAFDASGRDALIRGFTEGFLGTGLASQPSTAEVFPVLDGLITDLTATCATTPCGVDRTRTVAKAVCSALLGSAGVSIH